VRIEFAWRTRQVRISQNVQKERAIGLLGRIREPGQRFALLGVCFDTAANSAGSSWDMPKGKGFLPFPFGTPWCAAFELSFEIFWGAVGEQRHEEG